jgi:hypothetical protein
VRAVHDKVRQRRILESCRHDKVAHCLDSAGLTDVVVERSR